jgi:hypothetical protein
VYLKSAIHALWQKSSAGTARVAEGKPFAGLQMLQSASTLFE